MSISIRMSSSRCRPIYVAATSQHVGKTTTTLGLIHALQERGLELGYCKPVGQQYVTHEGHRVDKDVALFAQFMGFAIEPELHSPIILGPGDTVEYLDNPEDFNFMQQLHHAESVLKGRHQMLVFEGTGHPGVGSVADVSNSTVAHAVGAGLIMVVEAGIGNTIDRLDLNLKPFTQLGVPVIGVIINKCRVEKLDKVRYYVGKKLEQWGVPLLGVLPYEEELGLPLMETIRLTLRGECMYNDDMFDNRVKNIIAGSLIDMEQPRGLRNQLLVVSLRRFDEALRKIRQFEDSNGLRDSILSGIILTGNGSLKDEHLRYIQQHHIPVIRTFVDTYEAVIKISKIEVKINTRTPWKVQHAVKLFSQHIDLDPVIAAIQLKY